MSFERVPARRPGAFKTGSAKVLSGAEALSRFTVLRQCTVCIATRGAFTCRFPRSTMAAFSGGSLSRGQGWGSL